MFNYESRFMSLFTIWRWRCVSVSLYNIFSLSPCQCLVEPFVLRSKLRFSLSLICITCDTRSSRRRKKKKWAKAHRKAPHVNSPDPRRRFFNPARALRRLTNCERPRCDRWISGLSGRPPRPSRNSIAQPPIFSNGRKTAEIITAPFNWRIKIRQ